MLKFIVFNICCLSLVLSATAQINPEKIDIVRDKWGVAHIYAKTDAEVAYGLAWAHAEDDFSTIQGTLAAGKLMIGRINGKNGAAIDFFTQFIGAPELVAAQKSQLSPAFQALLSGYVQGINAYAAAHPKKWLHKKLFPIVEEDMLIAFVLSLSAMSGADKALGDIASNKKFDNPYVGIGSNAIAVQSKLTKSGETFLAVNSHQPFEGPASWYEVHLNSEEGWNMLGSLFPASPTIFHGVNEHLGWAHTVNHPDKMDIYQLRMDPEQKLHYFFDGKSISLEVKKANLKVKILGLTIPIKKAYYVSKYGPTLQNDNGFYALSFAANKDLLAIQQWYEMNKTKNLAEFKAVVSKLHLPDFNIVYADNNHEIYYVSNAKLPVRNRNFNWKEVLKGDTSATIWSKFHQFDELPHYQNPTAGFLFNMNNSPFIATDPANNLDSLQFPREMGYSVKHNNRSVRFMQLMEASEPMSYETFKVRKYDIQYPDEILYSTDLSVFFSLSPNEYPAIANYLTILQNWDKKAEKESVGAALFKILLNEVDEKNYTESEAAQLVALCQEQLIKHYGTIEIPLSTIQVHQRGAVEMAIDGLPDVIAPMYTKATGEKLQEKTYVGESYILLARFTGEGYPILESVMPYGASSVPESPHYTDQMEMFVNKELKPMTLDKATIYKEAVQIYSPKKE